MIAIDRFIYFFMAFTIIAAAMLCWTTPIFFWDFQVYLDAVELFGNGEDPYFKQGYEYVYPPLTLYILQLLFSALPQGVILALNLAVFFYLPFLLFRERGKLLDAAFVIFGACGLIGLSALITGNITSTLYLIVFLLFFSASKNKLREPLFAGGVLFVSLFKPYFLAFLILLPFINRNIGRSLIVGLAIAASVVLLIYFVQPFDGAFQSFLDALNRRTRGFTWDTGFSLSSILVRTFHQWTDLDPATLLIALHGLIFLPILLLFVMFRIQLFDDKYLLFVISTAIILNPRIKIYDMCILCFLIYTFYQNWFDDLQTRRIIDLVFLGTATFIVPELFGVRVQDLATVFLHITYVVMAVLVTLKLLEEEGKARGTHANIAKQLP